MRICSKCKRELDESCYTKNNSRKDGLCTYCKDCLREYNSKRKDRYPIKENVQSKECSRCHEQKSISDFCLDSFSKDGHANVCKSCNNKIWREIKRDKIINTKIEIKERECSRCHKIKPVSEFHKTTNSIYGINSWCKTCQSDYGRQYYKNTKQSRQLIRNQSAKEWREKQKDNALFKLNHCMSQGIYNALKENKAERHWETLVPYNLQQLKEHLESQFTPEMSWGNFGTYWEVDHIIPKRLFKFDTADDKDFKICWSLINLRPLSGEENRKRPRDGSDVSEEIKDKILNQDTRQTKLI